MQHEAPIIKQHFEQLLEHTIAALKSDAILRPDFYHAQSANDLESVISNFMKSAAKSTEFENKIELRSGHAFPDIKIAPTFGVEVKTTIQPKWNSIGNSVLETTRIEDVEEIYIIFARLADPIDFMFRKYEECVKEIAVTHSPRYIIDMTTERGASVFDKMGISYDSFRNLDKPVRKIQDYYRKTLGPDNDFWWLDTGDDDSTSTDVVIRYFSDFSREDRKEIIARLFALFPEVLGANDSSKYKGASAYLINKSGIVYPNIRDAFSAGGKGHISIGGRQMEVPHVFETLDHATEEVLAQLMNLETSDLVRIWGNDPGHENRVSLWRSKAEDSLITYDGQLQTTLRDFLHLKFNE